MHSCSDDRSNDEADLGHAKGPRQKVIACFRTCTQELDISLKGGHYTLPVHFAPLLQEPIVLDVCRLFQNALILYPILCSEKITGASHKYVHTSSQNKSDTFLSKRAFITHHAYIQHT